VIIVWQEVRSANTIKSNLWDKDDHFVVTYYHANKRCATCNNIEAYTKEATVNGFPEQIKSRDLKFKIRNWQSVKWEELRKKYKLMGNAVIVSEIKNGKEIRFNDLVRIWTLSHDKQKFINYIKYNVRNFIKIKDSKQQSQPIKNTNQENNVGSPKSLITTYDNDLN
jgi:hypothetical protein